MIRRADRIPGFRRARPARPARRALTAAAVVGAALVLAACGSDGGGTGHAGAHGAGTSAPAPAPTSAAASATPTAPTSAAAPSASSAAPAGSHNAADTAFAQQMIPHHRQAVAMADLAVGRASSEQVKQLAREVRAAQDPEIVTMTGWLTAWGEQVPAADAGGHAGHGGAPMPGMMTPAELEQLAKASGADFDRAFLTLMIAHHEGAVVMAEAEKAQGAYGPAKAMAGEIASAQRAEITLMKQLLAK
ncbi:DUF305 domain-containing protein [Kitasatospora sp. NPDC054939]